MNSLNLKLKWTSKQWIAGCCAAAGAALMLGYFTYVSYGKSATAPNSTVRSSAETPAPASSGGGTLSPPNAGAPLDPAEAYSSKHPALMGLSILDKADKVAARYGSPNRQYVMDDEKDPITVFEYAGFNAGFGKDKLLRFVEVKSADADPGLSGLRLGQKTDDAVKTLGKPDTVTDYTLVYRTKSTVLKLDIDPKTKVIQSIKLFGHTE